MKGRDNVKGFRGKGDREGWGACEGYKERRKEEDVLARERKETQ